METYEYELFKKALKESNKLKKFKYVNEEINMTHRAISLLIENGFAKDCMLVVGMEEHLVKMNKLRGEILKC